MKEVVLLSTLWLSVCVDIENNSRLFLSSCAWRRRRAGSAGTLNNDVRFQQGQGMNKFRESRKPAENK
jgi:hypothetical protein